MAAHRSRLPLAIAVAVVAAAAATLLLRPRDGLIEPAAVNATAYFSATDLQRAEDFRDLQRVLGLAGVVLSGLTVALIALRPPRLVRRAVERAGRRPLLGAAVVAAGIALAVVVVELPLSLWRHERAVDFGLSTQALGPWLGDVAKAAAVSAVTAAIAGLLAMALIRRFPRHWWAPGSAVVVALAAATLYLQPILVAPLFNDFEPLPRGELRTEVLRLADRAGVDVGEVYRVDASRRTTAINAYVGGLGHTKRVVLYDNLIDDFPRAQVRSVVAHELGHVEHDDLWHGLLWVAIVAPAAMLCVQRLAERFARGALGRPGKPGPSALPAVALAFALVSFALSLAGNYVSRAVEARADAFALELTGEPDAFVALERSLATRNLGDPDPPRLLHELFGTHPTTLERIGYGVTFERLDR
ncbi:MAG TPA: M48 family metalloprotease [Thermoleophilaceae bacterium]|nr:M48 family metalloprotease [Thermoleophilaceae bacterium]